VREADEAARASEKDEERAARRAVGS
jgi:hypothetical protein